MFCPSRCFFYLRPFVSVTLFPFDDLPHLTFFLFSFCPLIFFTIGVFYFDVLSVNHRRAYFNTQMPISAFKCLFQHTDFLKVLRLDALHCVFIYRDSFFLLTYLGSWGSNRTVSILCTYPEPSNNCLKPQKMIKAVSASFRRERAPRGLFCVFKHLLLGSG